MRNHANRALRFVSTAGMLVCGKAVGRQECQQQTQPRDLLDYRPHEDPADKTSKSNLQRNRGSPQGAESVVSQHRVRSINQCFQEKPVSPKSRFQLAFRVAQLCARAFSACTPAMEVA